MWRRLSALGLILGLAMALGATAEAAKEKVPRLKVSSDTIARRATIADEQVANSFGCKGGNISPEIKWSGAPAGTKSYAVTIYDPDAPTGSGFWHWVVYNIPAGTTSLPKNAGDAKANLMPAGAIQSRTDFGVPGYNGPCPPPGDKPHRYHITVFAVDVPKLDGDQNTPAAVVGFQLHFHTLAKGVITGKYGREK